MFIRFQYRIYQYVPLWVRKIYFKIRFKKVNNTPSGHIEFGVPLVEHCNLCCKGCDHFSPVAKKSEISIETLIKDFRRVYALWGGRVTKIYLLGGEPLLYSHINQAMRECREIFSDAQILILTNAVKLLNMSEEFWDACSVNNIEISITKYPINLNFEAMIAKAKTKGITLSFYNDSDKVEKTSYKEPIDLYGAQNPKEMYDCCSRAHYYTLKNGRFYHCTFIPCSENFGEHFHKKFEMTEDDYVDIYAINSAEDGDRKLAQYSQFCRYCDVLHNQFGLKWERSKKDISEWT